MGKVIYVRHGQASVLSSNYDQLSDLGKLQAIELGKFLAREGVEIDKLYTGPLYRHHQTTEGILQGMDRNVDAEEMEDLREHQGFSALKKLLPDLVESDDQIRELVNIPWNTRSDQIKHHMRIYENFSLRWAKGEFDAVINGEYQSWAQFVDSAKKAYRNISQECGSGMTSLVVTSGGPKAIACGQAMELNFEKTMRTSWVIFNCSVSEFLVSEDRLTLSTFNNVSFFEKKSFRTLV